MEESNVREHETNVEDLDVLICMGDEFEVLTWEGNNKRIELHISKCQETSHIVWDRFTCLWGGEFDARNHVVIDLYYQNWGHGETILPK